MTLESVPPYEMGTRHHYDDELEPALEALRTAFPARPVGAEDEHLTAMIATAHLLADKGDPVVRPVSNADAPATAQVSWLPKQRRNRMSDRNWTHGVALKVLAPATIFFTMLGGVAWAGGLPQPLQKTASQVAGLAGVTIDDGTDDTTEVETPDATDEPGTTATHQSGDETDPASTDNQDGDSQGEDNASDPASTDNQDGDSQGEDTSGDTSSTDNQDGDSQGEDNASDPASTDNQDGDSQDSGSGDSTSEDSQGDASGSQDSSGSGDSSGDSSGSGGDGQD